MTYLLKELKDKRKCFNCEEVSLKKDVFIRPSLYLQEVYYKKQIINHKYIINIDYSYKHLNFDSMEKFKSFKKESNKNFVFEFNIEVILIKNSEIIYKNSSNHFNNELKMSNSHNFNKDIEGEVFCILFPHLKKLSFFEKIYRNLFSNFYTKIKEIKK